MGETETGVVSVTVVCYPQADVQRHRDDEVPKRHTQSLCALTM